MLDRRIANIVKVIARECDRVTEAADQFGNAMDERVEAVISGMEHVDTELSAVNAALVNLQAKVNDVNTAKGWLEVDINALKVEIKRPAHTQSGTQLGTYTFTTQAKRKMTEEGGPAPECVISGGGGRVGRGHGGKVSKISQGLPSCHATPLQCARV